MRDTPASTQTHRGPIAALVDGDGVAVGIPNQVDRGPSWSGVGAAQVVLGAVEGLRQVARAGVPGPLAVESKRVTIESEGSLLVVEPVDRGLVLVVSVPPLALGAVRRALAAANPALHQVIADHGTSESNPLASLAHQPALGAASYPVLEQLLRGLGWSQADLEREAERRSYLERLHQLKVGLPDPDARAFLALLCERGGFAAPEAFLGAGWWGGVYRLDPRRKGCRVPRRVT